MFSSLELRLKGITKVAGFYWDTVNNSIGHDLRSNASFILLNFKPLCATFHPSNREKARFYYVTGVFNIDKYLKPRVFAMSSLFPFRTDSWLYWEQDTTSSSPRCWCCFALTTGSQTWGLNTICPIPNAIFWQFNAKTSSSMSGWACVCNCNVPSRGFNYKLCE